MAIIRIKPYLSSFLKFAGLKAWISLTITVFLGLTEGAGLMMVVPFLNLLGLSEKGNTTLWTNWVENLFQKMGVELSLTSILCAYVIIISVNAVVRWYQEVLNAKLPYGYIQFMQDRFYRALSEVEWLFFTRMSGADITRSLTGDIPRVGYSTQQLLQLIGIGVICIIYTGLSFSISLLMTWIALFSAMILMFSLKPQNRYAHRSGEAAQTSQKDIYSQILEHLGGMKIAKSYGLGAQHAKNFFALTNQNATSIIRFLRGSALTRMIYQIGAAVILSIFFYIAIKFAEIPATSLILLAFIFSRLLPRFSGIQQQIQHLLNALPSYEASEHIREQLVKFRESSFLSHAQSVQIKENIYFKDVSFSYNHGDGKNCTLRKIELEIPARSTVAITGPSGSGKTTLADLLLGLLTPTEGSIFIDGRVLQGEFIHHWRNSISYVPQDSFLFHDTIRNNLLWANKTAEEKNLWEALRLAAADTFVAQLPQGLDTVVGDRGMRLSGGERQRIAMARALLRKPTLLVLDEATSSLDLENEQRIQTAIKNLHGELTILLIAHHTSTLQCADKVIVLDKGEIVPIHSQGFTYSRGILKGISSKDLILERRKERKREYGKY